MSSKSLREVPLFAMIMMGDCVAVAVQVVELEVEDLVLIVLVTVGCLVG